jgi:hypothetical protein
MDVTWTLVVAVIPGQCVRVREVIILKGFDPQCAARKTARVWLEGKGGSLKTGQAWTCDLPCDEPHSHANFFHMPAAATSPKAQRRSALFQSVLKREMMTGAMHPAEAKGSFTPK